jgi:hypothetical protein
MRASVAWPATPANTPTVIITTTAVTTAASRGAAKSRSSPRSPVLAHAQHAAPRPHKTRPSVRHMWLTSAARGWNASALPAASASTGDAPGANLNR